MREKGVPENHRTTNDLTTMTHKRTFRTRLGISAILVATACGGGGTDAPTSIPPTDKPVAKPVVTSVEVSPSTGQLVIAQSITFRAVVRDELGREMTDRSVTWTSSKSDVASVDAAGKVTAIAAGTVTISAACEGRTGSAVVSVVEGRMIGQSGGKFSSADGSIEIDIPEGALSESIAVTATRISSPVAHPGLVPGTVWEIRPAGVSFSKPAKLAIRYEASALSSSASALKLSVRELKGAEWRVAAGGTIGVAERTVSGSIAGTGVVAIAFPVSFGVFESDFEGGLNGWAASGSESLAVSPLAAHSGATGLLVSNRSAAWQGAAQNVMGRVEPGVFYTYGVWLRMAPGEAESSLAMTMEWRAPGGSSRFEQVARTAKVTGEGWVRLEGIYALPPTVVFAKLKIESLAGTASYMMDDFTLTRAETPVQQNIPALRDVLASHFKIGTMMHPDMLGLDHERLVLRQFNSITPGNALKWESVHPAEGRYSFDDADRLVEFARTNGLQVRGHTFVWHLQTPAWVFRDSTGRQLTSAPSDKALLISRMEDHIRTVARRYGDKIAVWDVVNEVIDERQPDGLRRSPWYEIIGPDYIAHAFRVARQELPNAKLTINDYLTEVPARREALYRLVAQLKADGVPVDGVGHQMHNMLERPATAQVETAIQRFAALGVDQEITEMDITLYDDYLAAWSTAPAERLVRQGEVYRDMFDLFRRYSANISTVTVWGPSDDRTWLNFFFVVRSDWPLLFDRQLQAKPAYWGIVDPKYIEGAPLWARSVAPEAVLRRHQ